jgi:catechol 2,3-dioxygenase-like lactoylglutathione lyase family enzyme
MQLNFVTLGVTDLDAARAFYVDGLGLTPLMDVPGEVIFFQLNHGLTLGIYTGLEDDVGDGVALADPSRAPLSLSHNVGSDDEVRALTAAAEAAGAKILKPPQRSGFGGFHSYFADPAGFRWEICHNPGWSVAEDGTVSIGSAS